MENLREIFLPFDKTPCYNERNKFVAAGQTDKYGAAKFKDRKGKAAV